MRNALAALVFSATACAGMPKEMKEPVAVAGVSAPNAKIICRMERPIGSLIAERVCLREEEMDWNRQRTQEIIQTMRVGGPCTNDCGTASPGR